MLCERCPALATSGYEYPESYCSIGQEGEDFRKGPGCRLSYRIIKKRKEENDEAEARSYDGILEWAQKQQDKEIAMLQAIDKNLKEYRNGELFLCFRDHRESKYYPISGDGKIFPELAGLIQMSYEEFAREVKCNDDN